MFGLAKGLAIVEALSERGSLTTADAARASSTTRAAARRCLLTLAELGYVRFDGKLFHPLPRMRRLGGVSSGPLSLAHVAQPILDRARDELQESVSLAVLDEGEALFIARAEAQRIVSTGVSIGARLPAYCSATGRVLLGGLGDDRAVEIIERNGRSRRTPKTLVEPEAILDAVRRARAEGYAVSDEELELGMRSMAVPVLDRTGRIIAALSVSASSGRIGCDHMRTVFLPVLTRHAEVLAKNV